MDEKEQDRAAEQTRQDRPLYQDVTFGPALSDERAAEVMARNEAQLEAHRLIDFDQRIPGSGWVDGIERSRENNPLYCGPVKIKDLEGKQSPNIAGSGGNMTAEEAAFDRWIRVTLGYGTADAEQMKMDARESARYDAITDTAQTQARAEGIPDAIGPFQISSLFGNVRPYTGIYYARYYELSDRQAVGRALQNIRDEVAYKTEWAKAYDFMQGQIQAEGSEYGNIPLWFEEEQDLLWQAHVRYYDEDPEDLPKSTEEPNLWIIKAIPKLFPPDQPERIEDMEDICIEVLDRQLAEMKDRVAAARDQMAVMDRWIDLRDRGYEPLINMADLLADTEDVRQDIAGIRIGIEAAEEWIDRHPDEAVPELSDDYIEALNDPAWAAFKAELREIAGDVCKNHKSNPSAIKRSDPPLFEIISETKTSPLNERIAPSDGLNGFRADKEGHAWQTRLDMMDPANRTIKYRGNVELKGNQYVTTSLEWKDSYIKDFQEVVGEDVELEARPWRYAEISLASIIYSQLEAARKNGQTWVAIREYDLLEQWKGCPYPKRDPPTRANLLNSVLSIARGMIDTDWQKICKNYPDATEILDFWGIEHDEPSGMGPNIPRFKIKRAYTKQKDGNKPTLIYCFADPPQNILVGITTKNYAIVPNEYLGQVSVSAEELGARPDLLKTAEKKGLLDQNGGITLQPDEEVLGMQPQIWATIKFRSAYYTNPRIFLEPLYEHSYYSEPSPRNRTTMRKNVEKYLIIIIVKGWTIKYTGIRYSNYDEVKRTTNGRKTKSIEAFELLPEQ